MRRMLAATAASVVLFASLIWGQSASAGDVTARSCDLTHLTVHCPRADLHGRDLRTFDLSGANLRQADLHGAILSKMDLCSANLRGANLRGADLRHARLGQIPFPAASDHTRSTPACAPYCVGADLTSANLTSADLVSALLTDANLTGANLTNATLPHTTTRSLAQNDEGPTLHIPVSAL